MLPESTPKQEAEAIRMPDLATPLSHDGQALWSFPVRGGVLSGHIPDESSISQPVGVMSGSTWGCPCDAWVSDSPKGHGRKAETYSSNHKKD